MALRIALASICGRAEELIEGAPPSRPKAFVLSQVARFAMLSDEDERAVEVARETLAMVDELGARTSFGRRR